MQLRAPDLDVASVQCLIKDSHLQQLCSSGQHSLTTVPHCCRAQPHRSRGGRDAAAHPWGGPAVRASDNLLAYLWAQPGGSCVCISAGDHSSRVAAVRAGAAGWGEHEAIISSGGFGRSLRPVVSLASLSSRPEVLTCSATSSGSSVPAVA